RCVKSCLASTLASVLETLVHHSRVLQVPEIDFFGVVATEEQVESTITVVVKPDCRVRIYPGRKTGLVCDTGEGTAAIVVKQFRFAPLVKEEILVTVVVVVTPNGPHRNAGADLVDCC